MDQTNVYKNKNKIYFSEIRPLVTKPTLEINIFCMVVRSLSPYTVVRSLSFYRDNKIQYFDIALFVTP